MAAGQPNRDYFVPNRFGMPGMNNPPIGMIRGNLQQFGPRNNSPMFMWGPRAGWYHFEIDLEYVTYFRTHFVNEFKKKQ